MRRLIICSDGTWKAAESKTITNVTYMARAIAPAAYDGNTQIVFHDPGVGTGNLADKVSGGAYTARSTVGMIRKCGLLQKRHADRVDDAYELYRKREDTPDGPAATAFRAVAIDERRGPFKPTLWETQPDPRQIVEQAWFTGVHSDVGGGYEDRTLANITFQWMAKRAWDAGLDFDHQYLEQELGIDLAHPVDVDAKSYKGKLNDSLTGIYLGLPRHVRTIGTDTSHCEAVWHTAQRRADDTVVPAGV